MIRFLAHSIAVLSAGAAAAGEHRFTFVNASEDEVVAIYASLPEDERWGANFLPDTLAAGSQATITLTTPDDVCTVDLKFDYADSEAVEERGIDVCDTESYTISDEE